MITLKVNEVIFKKPVKVKEHIRIYGEVLNIGHSSIKVLVEAKRINFRNDEEESVCSTEMLFVKIDENGKAALIDDCVKFNALKK